MIRMEQDKAFQESLCTDQEKVQLVTNTYTCMYSDCALRHYKQLSISFSFCLGCTSCCSQEKS